MRLLVLVLLGGAFLTVPAPSLAAEGKRDAPPLEDSEQVESAPPSKGVSGSLTAGKEWRSLYGIPIDGYDLRATLGPGDVLHRHFLPAAFASGLIAHTEAGLAVNHVVMGARLEARVRYFYAGLSLGAGYFWMYRTRNGGNMGNVDGLVDLFLGPQIPVGDHVVLALEGRVTAEILPGHDDTVALGPGVAFRALFY